MTIAAAAPAAASGRIRRTAAWLAIAVAGVSCRAFDPSGQIQALASERLMKTTRHLTSFDPRSEFATAARDVRRGIERTVRPLPTRLALVTRRVSGAGGEWTDRTAKLLTSLRTYGAETGAAAGRSAGLLRESVEFLELTPPQVARRIERLKSPLERIDLTRPMLTSPTDAHRTTTIAPARRPGFVERVLQRIQP